MKHRENNIRVNQSSGGFTLIELLVVISIIALLLSILMPSLQRVREMGRRAVCGSNLRQIGLALEVYIHDQNGYYPPTRAIFNNNVLPGEGGISALERISIYLNTGSKERRTLTHAWSNYTATVDYYKEFICPSDRHPFMVYNYASSYGMSMAVNKDQFNAGWGLNYLDGREELINNLQRSRRATEIRRAPHQVLVVTDAWWDGITHENRPGPEQGTIRSLTYRHGNGVNPTDVYSGNWPNVTPRYGEDELKAIYAGSGLNRLWADGHVEYSDEYPISPDVIRVR